MALNFGPAPMNFEALGSLGKTFFDAQAAAQKRGIDQQKQQLLAGLGQGSGDFQKVGLGLIGAGDVQSGVALLGLAQKEKERQLEQEWIRQNPSATSTPAAPSAPSGATVPLGQSIVAPRGVQVANSEEDVQRLEAEAAGQTQFGQRSQPRGLRNNNPGNIESGKFAATVQGFQGSDGRFAQYATPEQGIQAADKLLTSYAARGLNTVAGIVNRWAPPTENNTGAYVAQVAKELGVDPNAPLDMNSPEVRQRLIAAKIRVENGRQPYSEDVFQRALNPNWQTEVASFEGGGAPVQVAQAPAQAGAPVADVPASGARPAQGFAVPGATPQQTQSIAADPKVQEARRRYMTAPTDRTRTAAKADLDLAIEDAKRRSEGDKPTEQTRNYEAYRREEMAAGREPLSRLEFLKSQRTQITNNVGAGETEEEKARGKAAGTRAADTMSAAASASKQLMRLGQINALMKNVETGRLSPSRMTIAALGKSLGVDDAYLEAIGLDPKRVGDAQALNAISGRMLVDMIGSGGFPANNFSNTDREFLTGTLPSLANDPRANKLLITAAKRMAEIDIEKAKTWRAWKRDNPKGSFDDFELEFADRVGGTDRFADLVLEAQKLTGGTPAQPGRMPAQQAPRPPTIASPEQALKLPSGTEFIDPNGVRRRVP